MVAAHAHWVVAAQNYHTVRLVVTWETNRSSGRAPLPPAGVSGPRRCWPLGVLVGSVAFMAIGIDGDVQSCGALYMELQVEVVGTVGRTAVQRHRIRR
eukprot:SAG22_NODE_1398_length_4507_cov_9.035617_4_plen_98_part_00